MNRSGFGLTGLGFYGAFAATLLLVGCGRSEEAAVPDEDLRVIAEDDTEGGSDSGEVVKLAFVTNQIADFWKISEAGAIDAKEDIGGIDVDVRMPTQATAAQQKRIIEDLLNAGVEGIAISPVDPQNQTTFLNEVADQINLITHDSDAPDSNRLMYIGMDNYAAGRAAGELVRQALPEGGEVMLFIGRLEQDNSKYRRQGVIDVLMNRTDRDQQYYRDNENAWDPDDAVIEGNDFKVLGTITDQGKPEVAQAKAEDSLNSYPEIDAMVGLFEYNPPAIYQALQKADKLGEIKLIGFDENDVTLQAIKDGTAIGTVVQNPYMYGYESMRVLKEMADDSFEMPEDNYLDIPPRTITKENVDAFWADLKAKKGQ